MFNKFFVSAAIFSIAFISGCGGGGGGGSTPVSLGGKIIDGYISGATVCLDLNSNNVCDSGEPSTTSQSDGSYTLNYSGNVSGLQIISQVPKGAVDSDLGTISVPYTLSAPIPVDSTTYANTHVTPLTTLVADAIQQAGGQTQLTPDKAQAQIVASLGLPSTTSLTADYKANGSNSLSQIATFTAVAMAQVSNNLTNSAAVSAQLTPGQITQSAIQTVSRQLLPGVMSNGALNPATSTAIAAAIAAKSTDGLTSNGGVVANVVHSAGLSSTDIASLSSGGTLSGSLLNVVNGTKNRSSSSTASLQNVFGNPGLVIVNKDHNTFINSSGTVSCISNGQSVLYPTTYGNNQNPSCDNILRAEFIQFTLDGATNIDSNFDLIGDKWFTDYNRDAPLSYDGTSWIAENNGVGSSKKPPTISNNCIGIYSNASITQQFCAVQVDVSGKTITSLLPDLCSSNSSTPSSNCSTATFPSGSYGYTLTLSVQSSIQDADGYNGYFRLGVSKTWPGYSTGTYQSGSTYTNVSASATLVDFINFTKTQTQYIGNNCNVPFQIDSYDPSTKSGLINFGDNRNGNCQNGSYPTFTKVEQQKFVVVTKGGKDVMIFPTPAVDRANNPGNTDPYKIFAQGCLDSTSSKCGIYSGQYSPINFSQSIPFNGNLNSNTQIVSPILFSAVMTAQGRPAYPYGKSSASGDPATSGPNAPY